MTTPSLSINPKSWLATFARWASEIRSARLTTTDTAEEIEETWSFPRVEFRNRPRKNVEGWPISSNTDSEVPTKDGNIFIYSGDGELRANSIRRDLKFVFPAFKGFLPSFDDLDPMLVETTALTSRLPVNNSATIITAGAQALNLFTRPVRPNDIIAAFAWASLSMETGAASPMYLQLTIGGRTYTTYYKPDTNDTTGKRDNAAICAMRIASTLATYAPDTNQQVKVEWSQPEGAGPYTTMYCRTSLLMAVHFRTLS